MRVEPRAWQVLLAMSWDTFQLTRRYFRMRVDDVAGTYALVPAVLLLLVVGGGVVLVLLLLVLWRRPLRHGWLLLELLLLVQLGLYRWFSSQIRAVQRGPSEDLGGFAVV